MSSASKIVKASAGGNKKNVVVVEPVAVSAGVPAPVAAVGSAAPLIKISRAGKDASAGVPAAVAAVGSAAPLIKISQVKKDASAATPAVVIAAPASAIASAKKAKSKVPQVIAAAQAPVAVAAAPASAVAAAPKKAKSKAPEVIAAAQAPVASVPASAVAAAPKKAKSNANANKTAVAAPAQVAPAQVAAPKQTASKKRAREAEVEVAAPASEAPANAGASEDADIARVSRFESALRVAVRILRKDNSDVVTNPHFNAIAAKIESGTLVEKNNSEMNQSRRFVLDVNSITPQFADQAHSSHITTEVRAASSTQAAQKFLYVFAKKEYKHTTKTTDATTGEITENTIAFEPAEKRIGVLTRFVINEKLPRSELVMKTPAAQTAFFKRRLVQLMNKQAALSQAQIEESLKRSVVGAMRFMRGRRNQQYVCEGKVLATPMKYSVLMVPRGYRVEYAMDASGNTKPVRFVLNSDTITEYRAISPSDWKHVERKEPVTVNRKVFAPIKDASGAVVGTSTTDFEIKGTPYSRTVVLTPRAELEFKLRAEGGHLKQPIKTVDQQHKAEYERVKSERAAARAASAAASVPVAMDATSTPSQPSAPVAVAVAVVDPVVVASDESASKPPATKKARKAPQAVPAISASS